MNISKYEQRTLHALARGGRIDHHKDRRGDIIAVDCITREGWRLDDCTLAVFRKLRKRRFIRSQEDGPYRVTREGLEAVRAQLDNRA
ncbi:MAG: YjhX family toxin [Hyphomonadaceae bacterium]